MLSAPRRHDRFGDRGRSFETRRIDSRKVAELAKEIGAMTENEIGKVVVDAAVQVHRELGPGLLETVYEVILELKSVERVNNAHKKQVLTYLRLTDMKLGYLLNFGEALMKAGITRTVNQLDSE